MPHNPKTTAALTANGPAFDHPALRQAVRDVLNTTILRDALAGDETRELISDLIDAYTTTFGPSALYTVLENAGCGHDLADDLSDRLARVLGDAAEKL